MNNKTIPKLPLLICLLFACALTSGCVVGRRSVALETPATAAAAVNKGTVALTAVTDRRTFENKPSSPSIPSIDGDATKASKDNLKTMIGRQRNGYGKAMGDIQLAAGDNVEAQMRRLVGEGFKRRGYAVTDTAADGDGAQVDVDQFWAWFTPGFVAVSFEANVGCKLTITAKGKTQVLAVAGYGKNTGQVASNANWQLAYTRAFEDFLAKLDTALAGAGL
jgi:uncharacterized lipoprotein YajG